MGENMKFIDNNSYREIVNKLAKENQYMKLDEEKRDIIEKNFIELVRNVSQQIEHGIENKIKKYKGVNIIIDDSQDVIKIDTSLLKQSDEYRATISISKLLIIANYEIFHAIKYEKMPNMIGGSEFFGEMGFNLSMRCMIMHELAHIYKGHLKLYDKWKEEGTLKEHLLDIQTLEWDADSFAATELAELLGAMKYKFSNFNYNYMKIFVGAIHGMIFWQRLKKDFESIKSNKHLPMFYREAAILACITDLQGERENVNEYVLEFENNFSAVFGCMTEERNKYFMSAIEEANRGVFDEVIKNWDKLKEELRMYSIFPLDELPARY